MLANHDVTRVVTRYGRTDTSFAFAAKRMGTPTDLDLGTRRARAAILLAAALPGTLYVYQGDELGLPEVEDIPVDQLQDPMHFQSGGLDPGRDGCRVPLPWSGSAPPFGFGPDGSTPWLPQPGDWAGRTVAAQSSPTTARCSRCTAGRSACAGVASPATSSPGCRAPTASSPSAAATSPASSTSTSAAVHVPAASSSSPPAACPDGRVPPDTAVWVDVAAGPDRPPTTDPAPAPLEEQP